jgi:hypothetical protein
MFNGVYPAALHSGLNGLIWYSIMSKLKEKKMWSNNMFIQCGIATIVSTSILHPLDVIKTTCNSREVTAVKAMQYILKTHGPKGLYMGLPIIIMTSIPSHTIAVGTFHALNDAIKLL